MNSRVVIAIENAYKAGLTVGLDTLQVGIVDEFSHPVYVCTHCGVSVTLSKECFCGDYALENFLKHGECECCLFDNSYVVEE